MTFAVRSALPLLLCLTLLAACGRLDVQANDQGPYSPDYAHGPASSLTQYGRGLLGGDNLLEFSSNGGRVWPLSVTGVTVDGFHEVMGPSATEPEHAGAFAPGTTPAPTGTPMPSPAR